MCRRGVLLLSALVLVLGACPLYAYVAGSDDDITVWVRVDGAREINVTAEGIATYQGDGVVTITVETNASILTVGGDGLSFSTDNASGRSTATASFDLAAFELAYASFYLNILATEELNSLPVWTTIYLFKNRVVVLATGDENGTLWCCAGTGAFKANLYGLRVSPSPTYPGHTYETYGIAGETITPEAGWLVADPPSAVTDDRGVASFRTFFPETLAESHSSSPVSFGTAAAEGKRKVATRSWIPGLCTGTAMPSGEVTFRAGSGEKRQRTLAVAYAQIWEMSGDVRVRGALSGEWIPAQPQCNLGYGDMVFLGPMNPQTYEVPGVTIRFFDRSTGEVSGYFTRQESNLVIKLGDYVETKEYTILTDISNLGWDIVANSRDWAKTAITYGVGKGVEVALGAYGWIAKKAGGAIVTYSIEKLDGWAGPGGSSLAPQIQAEAVSSAVPMDSSVIATLTPEGSSGSDILTSYRADGSADIINRGPTRVLTDGMTSVLLPPWSVSSVDFKNAGPPAPAVPMIIADSIMPEITVTPSDPTTVDTLQPAVTFDYSGSLPVIPSSFVARVNGYLVSPEMIVGSESTTWRPSKARPLHRGENSLKARITTITGGVRRTSTTLTATAALPTPEAPRAYPGRTKVILVWARLRDPEIVGFKVYRSSTAEGISTEISAGVLTEPLFVDSSPLPGGPGFYRIAGVTAEGAATPYSEPTAAALNPSAPQFVPPAVSGLSAVAGEGRVTLTFADPSLHARAFLVERRTGTNAWVNVLPNGGLVSGSPFTDHAATNATPWSHRVTPLGVDLVAGAGSTTPPVIPMNDPPAPPEGTTVDVSYEFVTVEWNPSDEGDVVGYHVERATLPGSFVRVTDAPVTTSAYYDHHGSPGLFAYRIIAVDDAGHESAPSAAQSAYVRPTVTITTPTGLLATGVEPTRVELSWAITAGAWYYTVERKAAGGVWTVIGYPTDHWLADTTAQAGKAYLYRVKAVAPGGTSSAFSLPEIATTVLFDDDPLTVGMPIRAVHLTQLRTAAVALRDLAGLGAFPFSSTPAKGVPIRAAHLTELRTAIDQARGALAFSTGGYTNPDPVRVVVKVVHVKEMRDRVK